MEIIDPHKNKERFQIWKKSKNLDKLTPFDKKIILQYVADMENGVNIAPNSVKGSRSYGRLIALKSKMKTLCEIMYKEHNIKKITSLNQRQLHMTFDKLRQGELKKNNGKPYRDVDSFAKIFTSFWHWYCRVQRKNGKDVADITIDLLKKGNAKPDWVYLNEEQFNQFINKAKYEYKVLFMFMYDSGIRAPKELANAKVCHLSWDKDKKRFELDIIEEASKTFGRKIKLMLCSKVLKNYIKEMKLKQDDYLFNIQPKRINEYMKRLASRIWSKDEISKGREKYVNISMYDLRHCSACYWIPRYKTENSLKYRFGWKKSDMLHYYTEFLSMKDNINEDDMIVDVSASDMQKKLDEETKKRQIVEEHVVQQSQQMKEILNLVDELKNQVFTNGVDVRAFERNEAKVRAYVTAKKMVTK